MVGKKISVNKSSRKYPPLTALMNLAETIIPKAAVQFSPLYCSMIRLS